MQKSGYTGFCLLIVVLLVLIAVTPTMAATTLNSKNRIIIGFSMNLDAKTLSKSYVADLLDKANIRFDKILHIDKVLKFAVIKTNTPINIVKKKLLSIGDGIVVYVEPDWVVGLTDPVKVQNTSISVNSDYLPNDPYLKYQWGLFSISAPKAWDIEKGNSSIIVAVIDTGIDYTHPDLATHYVGGYDFVNNDANPLDDNGHGTHCAGIIAAIMNNSIGVAGVAQVGIRAEKVLNARGMGYTSWIAEGIVDAVEHGARILSMSLGSPFPSNTLRRACLYAWKHNCLIVAAAGNDGWYGVEYPARYKTVMAVGALNPNGTKAWFSNYGKGLEIMAPGVDILSTMPTYPVYLNVTYGYPLNYTNLSGTSMAAPFVAGVAALVWSHYPNMTNLEVRWILDHSTVDLGVRGWDKYYGFGEVNAYYALLNASKLAVSLKH